MKFRLQSGVCATMQASTYLVLCITVIDLTICALISLIMHFFNLYKLSLFQNGTQVKSPDQVQMFVWIIVV